jgi:hypothetical protein
MVEWNWFEGISLGADSDGRATQRIHRSLPAAQALLTTRGHDVPR